MSDDHIRELVRKVASGDLDQLPQLVRAWERTKVLDLAAVDEARRRRQADVSAAVRDALTELIRLARENGLDIQDRLDAAIAREGWVMSGGHAAELHGHEIADDDVEVLMHGMLDIGEDDGLTIEERAEAWREGWNAKGAEMTVK